MVFAIWDMTNGKSTCRIIPQNNWITVYLNENVARIIKLIRPYGSVNDTMRILFVRRLLQQISDNLCCKSLIHFPNITVWRLANYRPLPLSYEVFKVLWECVAGQPRGTIIDHLLQLFKGGAPTAIGENASSQLHLYQERYIISWKTFIRYKILSGYRLLWCTRMW